MELVYYFKDHKTFNYGTIFHPTKIVFLDRSTHFPIVNKNFYNGIWPVFLVRIPLDIEAYLSHTILNLLVGFDILKTKKRRLSFVLFIFLGKDS